jgi:methyl-accepting chemotaxis protein
MSMSWARNLPLSRKFTLAFGVVCALCLVLGVYTSITFRSIAGENAVVSENSFPSLS